MWAPTLAAAKECIVWVADVGAIQLDDWIGCAARDLRRDSGNQREDSMAACA